MSEILKSAITDAARIELLSARSPAARRRVEKALTLKRCFDVSAVCMAMLLLFPLLLTVTLVVLIKQGRPILIRHKRVGKDGVLFPCLKFRTMVVNADQVLREHLAQNPAAAVEWEESRKLKDDPRVTPFGQIMRKLSIDELPQLINVLSGEMSLVGPRPIVLDEVPRYGAHIKEYKSVRPGLTGLWQSSGRSNVSYAQRVQMDCDYVSNWSFGRDLSIIMRTIPSVMMSKGSY